MTPISTLQGSSRSNILRNLLKMLGFSDIKKFQASCNLEQDGQFGKMSWDALYAKLLKVIKPAKAFTGFHALACVKKQIVWHHSAGNDSGIGMFTDWQNDNRFHVATPIGIIDSGQVVKGYDESFWAVHIGANDVRNTPDFVHLTWDKIVALEQQSVGVEICNWGFLRKKGSKFYNWANNVEIPITKVCPLSYKNESYYEAYTDAEMEALKLWTLLVAMRFDIPVDYHEDKMWTVSKDAINGKPGIFTHNSYIGWKSDVSPQPKLIQMAKTLVDFTK